MKCQVSLMLLGSLLCLSLSQSFAQAERSAQPLKLRRGAFFNEPALARSSEAAALAAEKSAGDQDKQSEAAAAGAGAVANKDASSGRLFLKKFLTFKNMFGGNNQPVIPIIITGAGSGPTSSSPTVSVTSTGTVPAATGTVSTSPTSPTSPTTSTSPTSSTSGRQYDGQADEQGDVDEAEEEAQPAGVAAIAANAELLDEQTLQAAIAAGAQEYEVFTEGDQPSNGATESKASQGNRINLRRKGGRRGQGQVISVRIPPRYRRYFKDGQKVMLNTKNRPNRRRVVKKRVQNKNKRFNNRRRGGKNKNKKNKNKRPRITVV